MDIHTRFMPGDDVWCMDSNLPAKKTITCARVVCYIDDDGSVVKSIHYSVDRQHKYFGPEQNFAQTKDELKEKIFNDGRTNL